jgi:pseudaminic acid synthase
VESVCVHRKPLGRVQLDASLAEVRSRAFRRFLDIVKDMKAGEIFAEQNLRSIRPGLGLSPKHIGVFFGKRVSRDVSRGTGLTWEHLG